MHELKEESRQLEIFYSFVESYDTLRKNVKEMALSGEPADYVHAEGICNVVASFIYETEDVATIINQLKSMTIDAKLNPIRENLLLQLEKQKDSILFQLTTRYQMLLGILSLRDTIRPSSARVLDDAQQALYEFTKNPFIKAEPGQPIQGNDLIVLNDIAAAKVTKNRSLSDYARQFRKPATKAAIKRLYYEASYYFEQAFSNTDVNIQYILLELINEDKKRDVKDEEKMKAIEALEDLHILATIDTSANKMTSKVSDHQAFELFLNALTKNNNDFILCKLVSDDIIMGTLFDVSIRSKDNYYGFRRIFTTARYPYSTMILNKYKKIKGLDKDQFHTIALELSKDDMFKEAYENYLRTEKAKGFLATLNKAKYELNSETLNDALIYNICMILKEFTQLETYNKLILDTEIAMNFLEDVYYHIIAHNAFGKYQLLETHLENFFDYRISHELTSSRLNYTSYGGETTFGITYRDVWYDVHKLIHYFGFEGVNTIFLDYADKATYCFEVGERIKLYVKESEEDCKKKNTKSLMRFNCMNTENKGFEYYVFNLFGRMIKKFMADSIKTTLVSIKSTTFRKIEVPGLSVKGDKSLRKAILDYMTLQYLWEKDHELFLHVYKIRANGILKAINEIVKSSAQLQPYVQLSSNHWVMSLFDNKATVTQLMNELDRFGKGARDQLFVDHGEAFFQLARKP